METQTFSYDMCRRYVEDLDDTNPFKKYLLGAIRGRNLKALCDCSKLVDMQSINVDVFRSLLQVEAFFKKNEAFSDKERCLLAAQTSFVNSELKCKLTNKRLNYFYLHPDRLDPAMKLVINRARRWISLVLGDTSEFIEMVPSSIRLTAGATASTSRRQSLPFLKVKKTIQTTSGGVPWAEALYTYLGIKNPTFKVTPFNRVEFVPKNWKTYRTIACEPEGVMPFQLAFDSFCKGRLRKYGFDLRDQSRNQRLAQQGSVDGSITTIDLAAASDTVSLNAVAWLFPAPWFALIKSLRCSHYRHPLTGKILSYEKFSSMGNGMTFGIETLIFAALLRAVGEKEGSVYGDDICIGSEYTDSLLRSLKFFGFTVNLDKSFSEGPYRESCGTHWFNGSLITPFYVRGNLKLKPFQAHVINGLVGVSRPEGKVWEACRSFVERERLLIVPFNPASTSGVFVDHRSARKARKTRVRNWITYSRIYEFRNALVCDHGIRSLLLWYHDSFRVRSPDALMRARVRSRYVVPLERYRQRRVVIHSYDESTCGHVPTWSQYLFRLG